MSLFIAWFLFPLVLALLSLGCGLLLEAIGGVMLPGALVLPAGYALVLVAAEFATMTSATARLAIPLVVALAVAGLGLSVPWRRPPLDPYALVAAAGTFLAFGAPVLLSGQATFAGYIKLDDTATWLALTDRVMDHGRSLAGLAPSSYWAVLHDDLPTGYPVGSFVPLGVAHKLVGEDAAWVFQPYLSFAGAMLALSLYSLVAPLIRSRPIRALVAFVASQPALLYAYALWGGIKEIVSAALLALTAALLSPLLRAVASARATLPIAVASAAVLGALSVGGAVWLAPILLAAIVVVALAHGRARTVRRGVVYAAFTLVLAIPALATAGVFIGPPSSKSALTSSKVLGNLVHPLSKLQVFGIWPTGDFRFSPTRLDVTRLLILILIAGALVALVFAWSQSANELLVYSMGVAIGCVAVVAFGSPWVDAKALATASPVAVLLGMAGAAVAFESGRAVEALVLSGAIAGGVLWSNALAYHDVTLAPRAQLAELARIDDKFKGQGPTLLNEYSPYGVRHFLRDIDAEAPSERRVRPIPLRSGQLLPRSESADLDDFQLGALLVYRTLVLRRSPTASRPPSVYRLVWAGRYYEVWQRPDQTPVIKEHLRLGSRDQPGARPTCADVSKLARIAGSGGMLATGSRTPNTVVELSPAPYPAQFGQYGEDRRVIYLRRSTKLAFDVRLRASGRYDAWLGGSFVSRLSISVDGKLLATRRHVLNWPGQFTPLGAADLTAGSHRVVVNYSGPDLHPGSGGNPPFGAGPLVFSRATGDLSVTYVSPSRARSLCGKDLDWIEAIHG
jgi:hypothetical protein